MKRLKQVTADKLFSDSLFTSAMESEILEVYNKVGKGQSRHFFNHLMALKSLDNWKENAVAFMNYKSKTHTGPQVGLYDPIYLSLFHNISIEEGYALVEKKKSDKATNKNGFIKRHGVDKGMKLFNKFQETSVSMSLDLKPDFDFRSKSVWCKEFYISRGYSETDAIEMAKNFNKNNSGANKYYWYNQGYSDKEVESIIFNTSLKKSNTAIKLHCERLGIDIDDYMNAHNESDYREYVRSCWLHTNVSLSLYQLDGIELRGIDTGFSLDHIYSINAGFLVGVEPKYIGHITNLRIVTMEYNSSKGARCDKTLNELISEYKEHESKIY